MADFFRRKTRLGSLVGEVKLVQRAFIAENPGEQEDHPAKEDAMMRIVRLISTEVSNPRLSFEGIGRGDFDIPNARWICAEGSIGIALLQDEDSRAKSEAKIHIGGSAHDKASSERIVELQGWLASTIYECRNKFGIEDIFWT